MTDGRDEPIGVLICDDVEAIRVLLGVIVGTRSRLRLLGEAADGEEAIEAAQRLQPDVILLDLAMPRLTGLEALPEIRRVAPHAKVIVLSGFASNMLAGEALSLGAYRYVEKGTDPETIARVIEDAGAAAAR